MIFYFLILCFGILLIILLAFKDKSSSKDQTNHDGYYKNLLEKSIYIKAQTLRNLFPDIDKLSPKQPLIQESISGRNSFGNEDVQQRYKKLEELFQEKSEAVSKLQRALDNEITHRSEFAKVKEILDTQVMHLKQRIHALEMDLKRYRDGTDGLTEPSMLERRLNTLEKL